MILRVIENDIILTHSGVNQPNHYRRLDWTKLPDLFNFYVSNKQIQNVITCRGENKASVFLFGESSQSAHNELFFTC